MLHFCLEVTLTSIDTFRKSGKRPSGFWRDDCINNGRSNSHQMWLLEQLEALSEKFAPHLSIKV